MAVYKDPQRKKNKWYCQFRSNGKRVKKRGFRTRKEAQEYELNYRRKYEGFKENASMLLKDFFEIYCRDKANDWGVLSQNTVVPRLKKWILPYFGERALNSITYKDVRKWFQILHENQLSETYKSKLRTELSSLFNHAVKYYELKENPCIKAGSVGSSKRKDITFWTYEEYQEFISHVDKLPYKVAFDTLYYTGLRIGELKALTLEDIDFSVPKIIVSKSYKKVKGEIFITDPKTESSKREVYIPQSLADEILELTHLYYGFKKDDFIFHYAEQTYRKELNNVCKKYGLKRIRIHDLRHSHASLLINSGYDILMVSERLGHSSPKMTLDIYSHLFPSRQKKLIKDLEKIF